MAAHTENSIFIAAPLPHVWQQTNDVENWPDLFTEYAKAEIIERDGDTIRFRLTMHPDEQGNEWSWVSERTADEASRTVTAERIETGWFEYMHIRWTYATEPGGTRMSWYQDFAMKPDSPLDDAGMEKRINANSAVQLAVIKERVEAAAPKAKVVAVEEVPANRRRGGEIRTVLSPGTVGSTSGFMGAAILAPGERIAEHYHPYSEEFLYLVRGALAVDLDGERLELRPGQGVYIPIGTRHRLTNAGDGEVFAVFHLGPLAPRPDLGHVDTETADGTPIPLPEAS